MFSSALVFNLTIIFYLLRHVIIHDMLYRREIQTLGGDICGH